MIKQQHADYKTQVNAFWGEIIIYFSSLSRFFASKLLSHFQAFRSSIFCWILHSCFL